MVEGAAIVSEVEKLCDVERSEVASDHVVWVAISTVVVALNILLVHDVQVGDGYTNSVGVVLSILSLNGMWMVAHDPYVESHRPHRPPARAPSVVLERILLAVYCAALLIIDAINVCNMRLNADRGVTLAVITALHLPCVFLYYARSVPHAHVA